MVSKWALAPVMALAVIAAGSVWATNKPDKCHAMGNGWSRCVLDSGTELLCGPFEGAKDGFECRTGKQIMRGAMNSVR